MTLNAQFRRAALLGAGAILCVPMASAQADTQIQVAEIIVSANRVPTDQARVGSSVNVIDAREIERRQQVQTLDVLKRLPGVSIARTGGFGSTSTLRLRGSESGMVKVLVDGVEVNDATSTANEFDFNSLLTVDIDRIEVLKGPQSALYGNDAMAGVINITTRQGSGKPGLRATAEVGAYGTFRQQAGVSGSGDGVRYAATASNLSTDGFSRTFVGNEKDGSDARTASGRLGLDVAAGVSIDLSAGWSWLDSEYDPFAADGAADMEKENWNARAAANLSLLDGRLENSLAVSLATSDRDFDEPTGYYRFSTFDSRRTALDYQGNLRLRDVDIATFGLSVDEEDAVTTNTVGSTSSTDLDRNVTTQSVFAQYQAALSSDLTVTLGGRIDDHEQFGTEGTWRATAAYQVPTSGTILRSSYGTARKAPSLFQLYAPFYGNANLKAERAKGFDAGVEQGLLDGRVILGATWFHNSYTNMIGFTNAYANIARARTRGVELTALVKATDDLTLSANYTNLSAKDRVTGRDLPRRPRHSVNAAIDWTIVPGIELGTTLRYFSDQRDNAGATAPVLDGATIFDLTGRWKVLDNVALFGRVENLFDEDYQEVRTYRAPGRSAFGGVTVSF